MPGGAGPGLAIAGPGLAKARRRFRGPSRTGRERFDDGLAHDDETTSRAGDRRPSRQSQVLAGFLTAPLSSERLLYASIRGIQLEVSTDEHLKCETHGNSHGSRLQQFRWRRSLKPPHATKASQ